MKHDKSMKELTLKHWDPPWFSFPQKTESELNMCVIHFTPKQTLGVFVLSPVQRKTVGLLQSAFPWADNRKVKRPVWRKQTRERVGERVRKKVEAGRQHRVIQITILCVPAYSNLSVSPSSKSLVKCASAWESGSSVLVCCGAVKRDLPGGTWSSDSCQVTAGVSETSVAHEFSFYSSMCSISPDLYLHPWGKCREWGECCITATQLAACLYLGLLLLA